MYAIGVASSVGTNYGSIISVNIYIPAYGGVVIPADKLINSNTAPNKSISLAIVSSTNFCPNCGIMTTCGKGFTRVIAYRRIALPAC